MTPDSISQAQLLFNLVLLASTVGNSILIARKVLGRPEVREISPQPLEVRGAVEYATKEDLMQLEKVGAAHRAEIRQDIQRLHERIDSLPDRMIAILRNTGAIK